MKKLFMLFALLVFVISLNAQSETIKTIGSNGTYSVYTPVASDTVCGTAVKYWTFFVDKPYPYYYVSTVRFAPRTVVARSVGNHVTLALSGSIDGTSFVTIDTCLIHPYDNHGLQGMNKVLTWTSDISTGVIWRYLRVTATGGDAAKTSTLTSLALKIGQK